jgi:peptidoglycan/LPS O-acetylase OafA/YrhL
MSAVAEPGASRPRLDYLDGWRGLSILLVLIGHFYPVEGLNFGRLGVELFFVLSGRLMAEILFVEKFPLPEFFRRRISRIVPGLFVFAILMSLASFALVALTGKQGPLRMAWTDLLAVATFSANYIFAFTGSESVLAHIWSVCIEEHAYILLAGAALLAGRDAGRAMRLLTLICLICACWGLLLTLDGGSYREVYWRTDVRVASIFVSAALFLLLHRNSGLARQVGGYWPILFLLGGVALNVDATSEVVKHVIGTLCLALAVNGLGHAARPLQQLMSIKPLTRLGIWSYSLYLWQQPFFYSVDYHLVPKPLLVAGAFAAGLASFYGIEQPARRWLNRHWRGKTGLRPVSA